MHKFTHYKASAFGADVIMDNSHNMPIYPLLKDTNGDRSMWSVSMEHGRSFAVGRQSNGKYVITKGNGLSYSTQTFMGTGELGNEIWGLLLKKDAIRDFTMGKEIKELGIKTNNMEYVLELGCNIQHPNGNILKPVILQYSVECPFRISDAPFMDKEDINSEILKWRSLNIEGYQFYHLIAAEKLIGNLRTLHDNGILHNAIHIQNYTWALELLDFELASSPKTPYEREDYQRHVPTLFPRETIHTYQIINYIANVLHEPIDHEQIEYIFRKYGFDLEKFICIKLAE